MFKNQYLQILTKEWCFKLTNLMQAIVKWVISNFIRPQTASNEDILLISICLIKIEIANLKLHTSHKYFFQGAWIFKDY